MSAVTEVVDVDKAAAVCRGKDRYRGSGRYSPALTDGNLGRRRRAGALSARLEPRSDGWSGSWGHWLARMSRSRSRSGGLASSRNVDVCTVFLWPI